MEPRKLTKVLVERGLVEKFVIDQLLVKLAPKETLADRLVADGLIPEADLLHLIAEEAKTRFVSSKKLDDLRLSADLMEFIPVEAAEANVALPLAYEASSKTLSIVLGDLSRQAKLDDLPRFSRLERVVACIGMPGAIRAAIRRNYHGEQKPKPKAEKPTGKCSQCGMPTLEDQLECGTCGLLLNPNAPLDGTEARIVRALLSEPTGMHRLPSRFQVHEGLTRRGLPIEVKDHLVPKLAAGMEIVRSLSDFEAFVVSFVDGQLTVEGLAQATNLMGVEVSSVLASLAERKVLALEDPTKPKEPPPPEPVAAKVAPAEPKAEPRPEPVAAKPAPAPARAPARPTTPVPPVAAAKPAVPVAGPGARAHADKKLAPAFSPATRPVEPPPPAPAPERPKPPPAKPRHLTAEAQMENSLQSALALERRGEVDGAITVLKIAIARSPKPAALYNRLALVLLHQRKDARQAEELIQKAMELEPENRVYTENLARVLAFAASHR